MSNYDYWNESEDHIEHFGIKGQKWGERRYQYEDSSLTPAGKIRYRATNSTATRTRKQFTNTPSMSDEYKQELEYNSQHNSYGGHNIPDDIKGPIIIDGSSTEKESIISNAHRWETRFDWDYDTKKTKISVIDKQYSPGKVNVLNEIKKSYGNALNTYVSGLNTIGSWASNLFKK